MEPIHKLITKYGLILAFSALIGHFWVYLQMLLFPPNQYNYYEIWRAIPNYVVYFVQVLVCILLIIDIRKYRIQFWLVPVMGLFYPLVGICAFLILYIYQKGNSTLEGDKIQ